MRINLTLPFDRFQIGDEFLDYDGIRELALTAERAGFASGVVTDHPCPTGRWLDAGGHHAQDPFVLLSFIAAATRTLRLQTGILVLPYRNPFLTARSVATLDFLSGGRVSLGVGSGYLKGEFRALGVDFESRNARMDEYLRALKAAWTSDEFSFEGTGYQAFGNRIVPRPIQRPHPPILIGGNSRRAIRRAVELGDAWNPFPTASASVANTSRTAEITNEADLAEGIAHLRELSASTGRARPPGVELAGLPGDEPSGPQELLDRLGRLAGLGVDAVGMAMPGGTRAEWCERVERFGSEVIARLDR